MGLNRKCKNQQSYKRVGVMGDQIIIIWTFFSFFGFVMNWTNCPFVYDLSKTNTPTILIRRTVVLSTPCNIEMQNIWPLAHFQREKYKSNFWFCFSSNLIFFLSKKLFSRMRNLSGIRNVFLRKFSQKLNFRLYSFKCTNESSFLVFRKSYRA